MLLAWLPLPFSQVPMDKPRAALDMITAFTRNRPMGDAAAAGQAADALVAKTAQVDAGLSLLGNKPTLRRQNAFKASQ